MNFYKDLTKSIYIYIIGPTTNITYWDIMQVVYLTPRTLSNDFDWRCKCVMKLGKRYETKYTIPTLEQPGYNTALDFFNFNLVYVILKLLYV